MIFTDIASIQKSGFVGFKTVAEMKSGGYLSLPDVPGVYLIVKKISFLLISSKWEQVDTSKGRIQM